MGKSRRYRTARETGRRRYAVMPDCGFGAGDGGGFAQQRKRWLGMIIFLGRFDGLW